MVTLHNLDDNTTRSALTDDSGGYLFENLKPGNYTVSASKDGFATSSTATAGTDGPSKRARGPDACRSSRCSRRSTWRAAAEQINTENATVGDTRGTDQLVEMPLNFRAQTTSPLAALALSPEHHHR